MVSAHCNATRTGTRPRPDFATRPPDDRQSAGVASKGGGSPEAAVTRLRGATKQAAATDQFKAVIQSIGDEVAYLDQPDFAKFWDEDAKRVEAAVHSIGRV